MFAWRRRSSMKVCGNKAIAILRFQISEGRFQIGIQIGAPTAVNRNLPSAIQSAIQSEIFPLKSEVSSFLEFHHGDAPAALIRRGRREPRDERMLLQKTSQGTLQLSR